MVLTGTFQRSLDEKRRFGLPKDWRQLLESQEVAVMYLTPGTDGSLALYPADAFEAFAQRLAASSPTRRDVRSFSRLFYSQAQPCHLDRQSRIRVSAPLAEMAGIQTEITLIGVRDYIEIWDSQRWLAYRAQQWEQYDAIAEQALSLECVEFPNQLPTGKQLPTGGETESQPSRPR